MHSKATTCVGRDDAGRHAALPVIESNAVSAPAMPSDFNGDGYADLAVGVPLEKVERATTAPEP